METVSRGIKTNDVINPNHILKRSHFCHTLREVWISKLTQVSSSTGALRADLIGL